MKPLNAWKSKFFYKNPLQYASHHHKMAGYYYALNKWLFYFFNILTAIAALTLVIVTTVIVSKLLTTVVPTWYLYFTTSISAITALISSLVNFFLLKDNINKFNKRKVLIAAELIKYKNQPSAKKAGYEWTLFNNVFKIVTSLNYDEVFDDVK